MKKIKIGTTQLETAPLNLGGNVFGWTLDEKQSFDILDAFAESGFNFIDTADTYSYWVTGNNGGESERIIGNWMKARHNRDKIIIATKVGYENNERPADISSSNIIKTIEESLSRLQTDYIDLYYTHKDDGKTPVEETLEAHTKLVRDGKVRHIGASNLSVENLVASLAYSDKHGIPPYEVYQPHYNLVARKEYESSYAPVIDKFKLAVLPYYSLASGFLTGKYHTEADFNKSQRGGGVKQYLNEKGLAILTALDQVSDKHQTVPATIALAWLLTRPHVVAPIVSATSRSQLKTLTDAPSIVLDKEDIALLDAASAF
ncbi:aldo/keto reductase [Chitinophaga flava]|uniref:Alcohol dehydrogenase n=1 Tax=Chitinophaga flava TaxID=2259036 RepID=A0A365Y1G2_9BACT|nr:aldo/keto reductase [Chitinophaga flava]RBL92456.1 alcohol dehydrogenase [Chitinophaga flava]